VIFFADENFAPKAARMLNEFSRENTVHHLTDHFEPGTADPVWLREIARWTERPVVLSADGRMLRNAVERRALQETNLTFVYLARGWVNTPWNQYAWKIVKAWPDILAQTQRVRAPTVFQVSVGNLKVERIGLTAEL